MPEYVANITLVRSLRPNQPIGTMLEESVSHMDISVGK